MTDEYVEERMSEKQRVQTDQAREKDKPESSGSVATAADPTVAPDSTSKANSYRGRPLSLGDRAGDQTFTIDFGDYESCRKESEGMGLEFFFLKNTKNKNEGHFTCRVFVLVLPRKSESKYHPDMNPTGNSSRR